MSSALKRPRSLREVSRRVIANEQTFDPAVREFLDTFYLNPAERAQAIAERPLEISDLKDAYLSATAEHLARLYRLPIPTWTDTHGWGLHTPFFAGGLESLKAILTVQSPAAFRRRMLFVSFDALDRASRYSTAEQ